MNDCVYIAHNCISVCLDYSGCYSKVYPTLSDIMLQKRESHSKPMEPMLVFPIARSTPLYERHKDENFLSNKVNTLQQVDMGLVYLHSQTLPPSHHLSTINVPLHVLENAVKMIGINATEALHVTRCQMPTSLHSGVCESMHVCACS